MEWTECIRKTISYVEEHLLEEEGAQRVSNEIGISQFYLQKGFQLMTGYSITEYIRNRRLYLAALDALAGREKVIDIAYRYGYETPESFTKAFVRFHGISPRQLKKDPAKMKIFLPLKIKITVQGGNNMDYTVEKREGFRLIGFQKEFSYDSAYREIPKFWDEFAKQYLPMLFEKRKPQGELEETVCSCCVGEFGVCIDDLGAGEKFRYIIGGIYTQGEVPQGMVVYEFPDMLWAKFACKGPLPEALQSINTKIMNEWLPGNTEYEIAMGANIEWYSKGDTSDLNYESGIWVPVKEKKG